MPDNTVDDIIKNGTKDYCSPLYAAEMYAKGLCPLSDVEAAIRSAMTAGATSMVEKMEGFIKWANQTYKYDEDSETWYNRNDGARHFGDVDMEYYTTSELREIYFEQLKKKEV